MFSPTVHILGETPNKSYLETIPLLISMNDHYYVEPTIHVEDKLFSITLTSETDLDSFPLLVSLQKLITDYLDWQNIEYIIHVDGM